MDSAVHLLTILIAAWVFGHVAEGFKMPAAVGQVLAGVAITLIGTALPPSFSFFHDIAASSAVQGVGEAGIIMLLLYAGIEMRPSDIAKQDRKSTRLNSSHRCISYAVFCLKKKIIYPYLIQS